MKEDKSCEKVGKKTKEKIESAESLLKQYGILEKMPGELDNVTVYC